jgi:hypothetical protein
MPEFYIEDDIVQLSDKEVSVDTYAEEIVQDRFEEKSGVTGTLRRPSWNL